MALALVHGLVTEPPNPAEQLRRPEIVTASDIRNGDLPGQHLGNDGQLHIVKPLAVTLEAACKLGLEGIVSKLAEAPYRSGRRREWAKTKCPMRRRN